MDRGPDQPAGPADPRRRPGRRPDRRRRDPPGGRRPVDPCRRRTRGRRDRVPPGRDLLTAPGDRPRAAPCVVTARAVVFGLGLAGAVAVAFVAEARGVGWLGIL